MLSLIFKDKGSQFHSKITSENYSQAKDELSALLENPEEAEELQEEILEFIELYAGDFDWFDENALKNANKDNLLKFVWLLIKPFELRLEEKSLSEKYSTTKDLNPTQKEQKEFDKYFKRREKIGTRFTYVYGDNPDSWTGIFSSGFQLARVVLGPFGIVAGKIPFVALGFFILWFWAAIFDWIVLSIPYLFLWRSSGLPRDYYDDDLLIGPYLYGDINEAKNDLRDIVKSDSNNSAAYSAALWGQFMREKYIEIIRKKRNDI